VSNGTCRIAKHLRAAAPMAWLLRLPDDHLIRGTRFLAR
jgi:hypothetical protein